MAQMTRESSRAAFLAFAVPSAMALLIWGYGGEDLVFRGGAGALLCMVLAVCGAGVPPDRPWMRPAGWLVALAVAGVTWASNHYVALVDAAFLVLLCGVFLALVRCPVRWREGILAACTVIVAAFSLYGFAQLAGHAPAVFWHNGLFASRYVNSAHFASLAAMAVPLGMGVALSGRGAWGRAGAGLSVPINLVALLLTHTRAAWLLAAVTYTVLIIVLVAGRRRSGTRGAWGWVVVAAALLTAAVAVWFLRGAIVGRFRDLVDTRGQGLGQRWQVWQVGFRMFVSEPLGVGFGCFGESYLAYKTALGRSIALRAHNEVVQLLAELGWVSVPLLLWLAWGVLRSLTRRRADASAAPASPLRICAAAGLFLVAAHSLVDFPLRLAANALYFAVGLSVLAAGDDDGTGRVPLSGRAAVLGVVLRLACAVGVLFWVCAAASSHYAERGYALADRAEYAKALPLFTKAVAFMPLDPIVAYERGKACRSMAVFAGAERRQRLEEAAGHFRWAIRMAPMRPKPHALLGRTLRLLGDREGAAAELQVAMRCDPTLGVYRSYYADLLLDEGRVDEAVGEYRHALALFHESSELGLGIVLEKLFKATGDEASLQRVTPSDEHSQRVLRDFVEKKAWESEREGRQ
jgi:tetratricopeptide (TPR) repeat protein